MGDPFDARTQMGPVVSERQRQHPGLRCASAWTKARGWRQGVSCRDLQGSGGYVRPTVLADVRRDMRDGAREEVFGPFTVVIPFDSEEEAIAIANDSEYSLAATVQFRDVARAHRVA